MDKSDKYIKSKLFDFYNNWSSFVFARDFQHILNYSKWNDFLNVIEKAITVCQSLDIPVFDNFIEIEKTVKYENETYRKISDFKLTRFACYLIVNNADFKKKEVAKALAFFYEQNKQFESSFIKSNEIERIKLREEIVQIIKLLNNTLYEAGIKEGVQYGIIHNERIKGLYSLNLKTLKEKKEIPLKESLYDYLGIFELSANLFQLTQINERIISENITGLTKLSQIHYQVGKDVKKLVEASSNLKLEDLPIEQKISKSERSSKRQKIFINQKVSKHILIEKPQQHFSSLKIEQCKVLNNLNINHLNKINIFAGNNNSGKTTLLEAIYLLANLNNINDFFEIQRKRGKHISIDSIWLDSIIQKEIIISGEFDSHNYSLSILKHHENNIDIDKSSYINTIKINSKFNDKEFKSEAKLYTERDNETYYEQIVSICNTTFSSPFSFLSKGDISFLHERNIELSAYPKIIEFLRKHIDKNIVDIDLIGEGEQKRFVVTHKDFTQATDLTLFGEGLQRIFYITLQFAISKNGILLIDELENAIHYSLLKRFTLFIQQLSEEFNVQVFITSHSKECIDAFIENKFNNDKLSFYRLARDNNNVECKYLTGNSLQRLLKNTPEIDIRGIHE